MEQLKLQLDELNKKFDLLQKAQDLNHNILMVTEIDKGLQNTGYVKASTVTPYGSNLQRTITIVETPESFIVPENPTNSAVIKASDGNYYRILLYSLT